MKIKDYKLLIKLHLIHVMQVLGKDVKQYLNTIFKYKMINFNDVTNENKTDHLNRILIIGGSGSGKTKALLNLINHQPDIDKIYLYVKDPHEAKYQYLINKREE